MCFVSNVWTVDGLKRGARLCGNCKFDRGFVPLVFHVLSWKIRHWFFQEVALMGFLTGVTRLPIDGVVIKHPTHRICTSGTTNCCSPFLLVEVFHMSSLLSWHFLLPFVRTPDKYLSADVISRVNMNLVWQCRLPFLTVVCVIFFILCREERHTQAATLHTQNKGLISLTAVFQEELLMAASYRGAC